MGRREDKPMKPYSEMCRACCVTVIVLLALAVVVTAPGAARAATTWVVDIDGHATAANCNDAAAPVLTSIQHAIKYAASGDTIFVCPGIYDEQVAVTMKDDITI